jgi:hypothetical protein
MGSKDFKAVVMMRPVSNNISDQNWEAEWHPRPQAGQRSRRCAARADRRQKRALRLEPHQVHVESV